MVNVVIKCMLHRLAPACLIALASFSVFAEEHVVVAGATHFQPLHLFVKPGDTIRWVNMIAHNTESMEGLIPEGAESWKSKLGQEYSITLDKEGAYIYMCFPHYANGMIAAIIVGEANNMDQLQANAKGREKGVILKLKKKLAANK